MSALAAFTVDAGIPWLPPSAFTPAANELRFYPEVHRYELQGRTLPSVTQILRAVGVSRDWSDIDPLVLERKRAIGQAVHAAAHYYDDGTLRRETVDPVVEPYLQAWRDFRETTGFTPALLETPVHHPDLQVAGTLDRAGTFAKYANADPGDLQVVDLKCGNPEDAGAQWQTAAYTACLAECLRPDVLTRFRFGREHRFSRPRYSVQLFDTGRFAIHAYRDLLTDVRDFTHMVTTFRRQHVNRGRQL